MTDAQKAAKEILELFSKAGAGVVHVNPDLFKNKSIAEIEDVKKRVRAVIRKYKAH